MPMKVGGAHCIIAQGLFAEYRLSTQETSVQKGEGDNLRSTARNQKRRKLVTPRKRRHQHGTRKQQVPANPSRQQIRPRALEPRRKVRDALGRARREARIVGGADEEREEGGAGEVDDREDDERGAADAANLGQGVLGVALGGGDVVAEVGLADPGCAVKVEGEPAWGVLASSGEDEEAKGRGEEATHLSSTKSWPSRSPAPAEAKSSTSSR